MASDRRSATPAVEKPLVAITGSQPPYIFDLPQLLSLPDGVEFRFRYSYEWVSDELRTALGRDVGRHRRWFEGPCLTGKTLLLVFHSQESQRLLPLRRCTIVGAELLGPMVFVRFRVGPFASVSPNVITDPIHGSPSPETQLLRDNESRRLTETGLALVGLPKHDLRERLPTGHYLRRVSAELAPDFWSNANDEADKGTLTWAALAALLQSEPNLRRVPLFRLIGFQESNGKFLRTKSVSPWYTLSHRRQRGFRLTEGRRYRLRLLEWCETIPGGEPGTPASVTVPPQLVSLEGSSNLIVGKYDVLEFSCTAGTPGNGELAMHVEPPDIASGGDKVPGPSKEPATETKEVSGHIQGQSAKTAADQHRASPASRRWPYILAVRVPIRVTQSVLRVGLMAATGIVGLYLYLWIPPASFGSPALVKQGTQLIGLLMMFTALGDYLHRFAEFTTDVKEIPFPGAPSGPVKP